MKMNGSVFVLGRDPDISLSELERLFGDSHLIKVIGRQLCLIDIETKNINLSKIGGSIKVAELITSDTNFNNDALLEKILVDTLENLTKNASSKVNLGISVFDSKLSLKKLNTIKIAIKNHFKNQGQSIRLIPNNSMSLTSAQTLHNNLHKKNNIELLLDISKDGLYIAKVTDVQDIESYSYRDRLRPKRDTRVGMLPPKLAQIMLNLAAGNSQSFKKPDQILVLDPFCGTGVVLQEAALMSYKINGTDLSQKMIDYTQDNLRWIKNRYNLDVNTEGVLEQGDATSHRWASKPDIVVSEIYLGPPITQKASIEMINKYSADCRTILEKFLNNLARQTDLGTRLCLAIPAWRYNNNFIRLTTVDRLPQLGYNQIKFKSINYRPLIYHRQGQFVARELLVLEKI